LKITTDGQRRELVNSASKIIDTYHFRGIDWDLEHGIGPIQVAQASKALPTSVKSGASSRAEFQMPLA
jgi:chitinase